MSKEEARRALEELEKASEAGGGDERVAAQRAKGKLTARERIELLLDDRSFEEMDRFVTHRSSDFGLAERKFVGDGVVAGYGKIDDRVVFVFAHDFTVLGGSLGEMFGRKIAKIMDAAMKAGAPIIGLNDSGGARIQEGVLSLAAYSEIFYRNTLASGVVPQISAILGPCAGGAVYSPAMTDFTVMVNGISHMFVTGPEVVKAALGETVSLDQLGSATVHGAETGVAEFVASSEEECMNLIGKLLSYLPSNNSQQPPRTPPDDEPDRLVDVDSVIPDEVNKAYNMSEVISKIVDSGEFLEVHREWAKNMIVGFARFDGQPVGVVANQPSFLAGTIDIKASNKAARFVRFCDAFNIPVVTFVDVPGFLPGLDQERGGIISHGSKLLYAYCEATVPKITIIVRKAYGGAYCAMGGRYSRSDLTFAWPFAEIAVMGPEAAVKILYRSDLAKSSDPERDYKAFVDSYKEKFANPYVAAEKGLIDAVIRPSDTRVKIIKALAALEGKSESRPLKKHGNIRL